ncbi:MAG: hypothetical protein ABW156_14020 [Jiangellaceae bacterium]
MITGDGGGPLTPVGVISAVIRDAQRPGLLLLGVRRPSALAPRFPGVLSTPTMRVSPDTFARLSAAYPDPRGVKGMTPLDGPLRAIGGHGYVESFESLLVEHLFLRKLMSSDALVDGRMHGVTRARCLSLDEVPDPLGTDENEWTAMLTFEVEIRAGADTLPGATASYSRLVWVEAAKVPQAMASHDALLLDETLNAAEVCIQGMCVRVAAHLVALNSSLNR